jgi:hypothetical protein
MSDLSLLFLEEARVAQWEAERSSATANLQIAKMNRRCAYLISQHDPVTMMGLDRERLRLVLSYVRHGDIERLKHEFEQLQIADKEGVR